MEFVLITLILFFIEVGIVYGSRIPQVSKEKCFYWLFSVQAFILFAFRDLLVLPDTLGYYYHFNDVKNTPLFEFDIYDRFGVGYLVYEKFIHNYISNHFLVFNVITTAFTMIPVLRYFRKNSNCLWFTFLLFISSRFIYSEAIALRQGLALGVCMMGAKYLSSEKTKLLKFLPYILLAITIHATSVMYLAIFGIYYFNKNGNKKVLALMLLIFTFIFTNFDSILGSYYAGFEESNYLRSASDSEYFNLVGLYSSIVALVIYAYVYSMRRYCNIKTYDNLYVITIFYVLVSLLSIKLFVITRYQIYLFPFVIVYATQLYSKAKLVLKGNNTTILFLFLMIANYLFIIYTRPEWVFFSNFKFWTNDISSYSIL